MTSTTGPVGAEGAAPGAAATETPIGMPEGGAGASPSEGAPLALPLVGATDGWEQRLEAEAAAREAQALGHAPTGADWLVLVARRLERRAAPERPLCTVCRRRTVAATRAPGDPYVGQCGACRKDSVRKAERAQARADARALDRAKLQRTVAAIRVHVQSLDAALRRNAEGEAPCATP